MVRDYFITFRFAPIPGFPGDAGYGNAIKKSTGPLNYQVISTWKKELEEEKGITRKCIILGIIELEIP